MSFLLLLLFTSMAYSRVHLSTGEWALLPVPGEESYLKDIEPTGLYLYPYWPEIGIPSVTYPNFWSLQKGISDTILLEVVLCNNQALSYPVTGNPEQWFDLALFTNYYSVQLNTPIKSGEDIGSRFFGWKEKNVGFVSPPTSIPPNDSRYTLVFTVWSLPPNISIMALQRNGYTPGDISLPNWVEGPFMVGTPTESRDTINALAHIGFRYSSLGLDTVGIQWADSIITLFPYSIVGWMLKSRILDSAGNREASLRAIDYTLWIFKDGMDPIYPFRRQERSVWYKKIHSDDALWLEEMYMRTQDFRKYVDSFHEWRGR